MTSALTNSSIRVRLSFLVLLNSSLALLLAGIALFAYENYQQRQSAMRELEAQAGILAESSTAALSFNDERAATQTLAALKGNSHIVEAIIYDRNNVPFSHYRGGDSAATTKAPSPREPGAYFENGALLVFSSINLGGEKLGTVFLRSNNEVYGRLYQYIGLFFIVMLVSQGLALLFSSGTQRSIAHPITDLSAVARRVSEGKNYSIRANRGTGGEIGDLIDSFNHMLSQIEARDQARKEAEALLLESEQRYALAARGANDGLWDWKLTTNEIYFSPRWNEMLGYQECDVWSDPEEWFSRIHASDRDRVRAEVSALREGRKTELCSEYRMQHKNGSSIWMLSRGIAITDAEGTAIRMAGSQTDITEGKIADPLTGLPNRLYLIDKLYGALESAEQRRTTFAVLFLDLDKFKLVNDSLGHAAGDELLMGVAARLRASLDISRSDCANEGGSSVVARLGGDEFAILLDGLKGEADAALVAVDILDRLNVPFSLAGQQMFASASIGIAMSYPGATSEDLLRNADTAMYYAKAKGKSRFEIFNDSIRERAVARLEMETDLRKAVNAGELAVHYQPQVSLTSKEVIGYEALVRWNHPVRGFLSPAEFIPIAEESDLIVHLGRWVLREACRQMAEWHIRYPQDVPLTISVNVSPKQLIDPGLVKDVATILTETSLNPCCLKLEMTESSIMGDPKATLATLNSLKRMNLGLEIDDFGTGYSSLSYLHLLPFDTVKIDRSFIKEIGIAGQGSEIVRTILELARSLGMRAIAEGLETNEQLKVLKDLGCRYAQGYYFARPTSAEMVSQALGQPAFRENLAALCLAVKTSSELDRAEISEDIPILV